MNSARTTSTWSGPPQPTAAPPAGRRVVIVTFDAAQVLDVTGPLEVFSSASRFLPAASYHARIVTTRGGPVRASSGFEFASTPIGDVAGPVDTLLVAGGSDMDAAGADSALARPRASTGTTSEGHPRRGGTIELVAPERRRHGVA